MNFPIQKYFKNFGNWMHKLFLVLLLFVLVNGCGKKLPVIDDFGNNHFNLVNQDGNSVVFPDMAKGEILIMNFIFTNCSDICPLSTNNMRLIQERIKKEKIVNVRFVSLSFDPLNDTPEVLTKFAGVRNLDLSNWDFLTGDKKVIDALIKQVGVLAVPADSTVLKNGRKIYYYVHTDRISLIDTDGGIRKNYIGSKINIDEIIEDLKSLK
jgi:protein SCO1/2